MGWDLVGLDSVRAILREPVRAAKPILSEPGSILADPVMAARLRLYLVRDQPADLVSCKTISF